MEHRQIVAVTVGGALFGVGAAALIAALTVAITIPDQETALWFRPLVYGGTAVVVVGVYFLLATWLGLWLPSPRDRFIGRTLWDRAYFSRVSRTRRERERMREVDNQLRARIEREAEAVGFTARRAVQTLCEEIVDPPGWAPQFWVIPDGNGHMLGCRTSGNVTPVDCTSVEDDEAQTRIRQFNAIGAAAREWPEGQERLRLHTKLAAKRA
jgi:hypothetical protein